MTRIFSLICFAAAAISTVSAVAVSSIAPSAVESGVPVYSATPAAVSNSTLEDRSTIEARASGGFANSCQSWGGLYGQVGDWVASLQATCRTKSGGTKKTWLDLNRCLVNDMGTIRCQTNGGFLGSCQPLEPYPTTGNTKIKAICGNGRGGKNTMSFDLNSCVGNSDGNLVC